jgi:hypothetical protein
MRSVVVRASTYGLGLATIVGLVAVAHLGAQVDPAPEIDGASISAGLALLTAVALIVRSHWGSK